MKVRTRSSTTLLYLRWFSDQQMDSQRSSRRRKKGKGVFQSCRKNGGKGGAFSCSTVSDFNGESQSKNRPVLSSPPRGRAGAAGRSVGRSVSRSGNSKGPLSSSCLIYYPIYPIPSHTLSFTCISCLCVGGRGGEKERLH